MFKKLLFAGGMAYLWRKFSGGSHHSRSTSPASSWGGRRGTRW